MIVADTGVEILIVVHANDLIDAEKLQVTFQDGAQANAKVKAEDGLLGLSVVTVADADLSETTKSQLAVATLGSSSMAELTGTPVITIGAPAGIVGSICYGTITSAVSELPIADASYKRITTDIYGNSHASGVMVNLNGQVIGIIDMQHNDADSQNVISAIGITECKPLIEKLSNGQEKAYLGIHATDVTETAQQELKIPAGAYITKIDMDSPAMNAGIQSGDVITAFNDIPISSTLELINELNKTAPGRSAELLIMRQGPDEYSEMHITLSFTSTKSLKAE